MSHASVVAAGVLALPLAHPCPAQEPMVRVDLRSDGTPGYGAREWEIDPLSADGRWIAFVSRDDGLVAGDANGTEDVFVRDLATGTTVLVSVATDGTPGDHESIAPAISGDGRLVVFSSYATTLVAGDTNGVSDVFLHDRDPDGNGVYDEPGATTLCISRKTNGQISHQHSLRPSISADGSYVAFESAEDLDGVNRTGGQVFGYDVATGALECLSGAPDGGDPGGDSWRASVSRDGTRIAFVCAGPWVLASDRNGNYDVFVRDRAAGTTLLASVSSTGVQGDDDSFDGVISGDGTAVAFTTEADNLIANDKNQDTDVLLRDLVAGTTELVSRATDGTPGDRDSRRPSISDDGSVVAFESAAWNLLPNDLNRLLDVFVLDRATGLLELASETCVGFAANQESSGPALSGDGTRVSFFSRASDLLPDLLGGDHVYVRDRDVAWPVASHRVYGAGWPGTLGIPALDASGDPAFGTNLTVTAQNSSGAWNVGFLLIGLDEASIPSRLGGTFLVDLAIVQTVVLPPFGWSVDFDVPLDPAFCGVEVDVQLVEIDPGASAGFSFTPGLELIFGR